jgi:predicted acetyltransferase
LEIRNVTPDDKKALEQIFSHSFQRGETTEIEPDRLADLSTRRIGVFAGGRLQATLSVIDFRMLFENEPRPCGGIAGVATDPSARGRGYAGALLRRSLEIMRESGQYLSSLWPFDYRYYRLHGWDWTGYSRDYKLPLNILKNDEETQYVEALSDDIPSVLGPIYEAKATQYHGMLARDDKMWAGHLEPWGKRHPAVYVYRRDGYAEGYAIVRYKEKHEEGIRASELVTTTTRAYQGLLGLLRHHSMTVDKVGWSGPPDDPLWSIVAHWDIETKLVPCGMGRIVDVPAAMQALRPPGTLRGSSVLAVEDEHASWNAGTWRVTVEGGGVEVSRTDASAGVSLDIQALTQAYWGTPSLYDLRAANRMGVHDEADFALLANILPSHKVWLYDDF